MRRKFRRQFLDEVDEEDEVVEVVDEAGEMLEEIWGVRSGAEVKGIADKLEVDKTLLFLSVE